MQSESINYFLALVHYKNFTKAAEALHVTQPTISRHIRSLEAELDIQLFESRYRDVKLSPAGKMMYNFFDTYTEEYSSALYKAHTFSSPDNGLTVLILEDLNTSLTLKPILRFQSEFEDSSIALHIETTSSWQIPFYLKNNRFDIIITLEDSLLLTKDLPDTLECHPLLQGKMCLFFSNLHPAARNNQQPCPADFLGTPLLVPSYYIPNNTSLINANGSDVSIEKYYNQLLGYEPQIIYKNNFDEIQLNVESGGGFFIASEYCRIGKSKLIRSIPLNAVSNIIFAWKKENPNVLIPKIIDSLKLKDSTS